MPKLAILTLPNKYTGNGVVNTSGTKVFTPEENKYFGDFNLSVLISLPTLYAPVISLSGNILTITKGAGNGNFIPTSYIIYKNGVKLTTIEGAASKTVDLSTLITQDGSYNIYVIAVRDNFINSNASNTVVYTKERPPYTVTINEIRGTSGLEWSAYDGQNDQGTYLKVFSSEATLPISLQINSGYLYLRCQDNTTNGDTSTGTIVQNINITNDPVTLLYKVNGSGSIEYISATDIIQKGVDMAKMIFIPEVATEVERTYTTNGNYNINVGQAMSKITINANISQPKLYTPIISLSGNTLYISDSDNGYFASSYDVYYGASLPHNISRGSSTSTTTEVNLQTFITASGTYTITVVAKANNFVDSDESDSVSYTVTTSGYSVSCSSYADKIDTALHTYYSTNNGSTWTEFDSTGVLTSQATQIKFRMTYPSGLSAPGTPKILSEQLGMTLSHSMFGSGFDITSDNYILTEDITDVTYNESI